MQLGLSHSPSKPHRPHFKDLSRCMIHDAPCMFYKVFFLNHVSCILLIFICVHLCQLASPKCPTTTRIFVAKHLVTLFQCLFYFPLGFTAFNILTPVISLFPFCERQFHLGTPVFKINPYRN